MIDYNIIHNKILDYTELDIEELLNNDSDSILYNKKYLLWVYGNRLQANFKYTKEIISFIDELFSSNDLNNYVLACRILQTNKLKPWYIRIGETIKNKILKMINGDKCREID